MTESSAQAPAGEARIVSLDDVEPSTYRGGEVRTLLSPKSTGATTGFMGVATIPPGDRISEHYHPYSEEFIYVVSGQLDAQLEGTSNALHARQGLMIPINVRHRLVNDGGEDAFIVFHLAPLAPRPDIGHVDTE